ncbi:MAG TPA: hypothetical protein VFV99_08575, partial [Kofleriaceae bacterium]|nr:hypothetical protein [Kofleriaceae bacterium]
MTAAETLLAEAVAAVNAGDYKTAANRFERAGELLSAKSGKKLGKGRARDAAAAYESAARCYLMLNDHNHAIAAVELARRLQPASPRVARVHAEVADRVGYAPTRRQAWQDVLTAGRRSDRMFAQLQLASIARELGEHA